MASDITNPRRIVLFDGVCSVCDSAVHFIYDRDSRGLFEFAPLQSPAGQAIAEHYGVAQDLSTIVLIEGDRAYTKSTAALRIARALDGAWPLAYGFTVVPRSLRDVAYRYFAAHRYRWFGQLEHCRVPEPEMRRRFLDLAPEAAATRS